MATVLRPSTRVISAIILSRAHANLWSADSADLAFRTQPSSPDGPILGSFSFHPRIPFFSWWVWPCPAVNAQFSHQWNICNVHPKQGLLFHPIPPSHHNLLCCYYINCVTAGHCQSFVTEASPRAVYSSAARRLVPLSEGKGKRRHVTDYRSSPDKYHVAVGELSPEGCRDAEELSDVEQNWSGLWFSRRTNRTRGAFRPKPQA